MEKVYFEALPAITVASHRAIIPSMDDLGRLCYQVIGPEMARLGCECPEPGYCYTIEHGGYKPKDIDIEYCEKVTAKGKDSAIIKFKDIPEVPTAVCMLVAYCGLIFGLNGYLTWMPKYLQDTFSLSLSSAGFHSMFWTHAAAFVGVLVAGALSDRIANRPRGGRNRLLLQAAGLLLAAPCIVLMGLSSAFVTVCAALAGFGFFRAFFDAGTYAVLYDVIESKYYSMSSAVLILFGFGIGALAPWILGIIGDTIGLSAGIASLAAVWVVGSIALLVARVFFYDKDATRLKPRSV